MRTLSGVGFAPNIDRASLQKAIAKYQASDKHVWAILRAVQLRTEGHTQWDIQTILGQENPKLTPRRKRKIKQMKKSIDGIKSMGSVPASDELSIVIHYNSGSSVGTINRWLTTAHKLSINKLLKFAVDKRQKQRLI